MARVTLRSGRVQPVWAGHPWVFAQAIQRIEGAPAAGDAVEVCDPGGKLIGRGFWSPKSAIPVRIVTRDPEEALDEAALVRRVELAAARRRRLGLPSAETDGYRLVHAEGDDLPGLICDVYRDVAVVQLLTHGIKRHEEALFGAISRVTHARAVVEVPGGRAQRREGIEGALRVARGPDVRRLVLTERGFEYAIELDQAQKTGFYFDQRDNRASIERFCDGARVLDLYSYVGAFALAAARGGATEVLAYDSSAAVIAEAASIAHANGLGERIAFARGDVRRVLQTLIQDGERFDVVVVDPPKLAPSMRHLRRAQEAYRRLNQRVFDVVADGGIVMSCSCSGALRQDDMLRTLALAGADARRGVRLLHVGQQGMDHPVPAAFPEGRYLKAMLLEVT